MQCSGPATPAADCYVVADLNTPATAACVQRDRTNANSEAPRRHAWQLPRSLRRAPMKRRKHPLAGDGPPHPPARMRVGSGAERAAEAARTRLGPCPGVTYEA